MRAARPSVLAAAAGWRRDTALVRHRMSHCCYGVTAWARAGASDDAPMRNPELECVLLRHPGVDAAVTPDCFEVRPSRESGPLPPGHVRVRTLCLSVDPYMRCRLDPEHPQLGEYLEPVALGTAPDGGGIGRVYESSHPDFTVGDLACVPFTGYPWRTRAVLDASCPRLRVTRVPPSSKPAAGAGPGAVSGTSADQQAAALAARPSLLLGALGMPGLTSWFCMLHAGRPRRGDTVLISGAAGACGSLAGQIARLEGLTAQDLGLSTAESDLGREQARGAAARVVGICGSAEKCDTLVRELGFDAAVSYRDADFDARLRAACPDGVDVYMDNVGGEVSVAALQLCNPGARVPICGQIAEYNSSVPYSELVSPRGVPPAVRALLERRGIERGRFLVLDYAAQWEHAQRRLCELVVGGRLAAPEHVTVGFAPGEAFCDMMAGGNVGKAIVYCDKL